MKSSTLTLTSFAAAMAEVSKVLAEKPIYHYCVTTPQAERRLKDEFARMPQVDDPLCIGRGLEFYGMQIFAKVGQVADAWMFTDSKLVREYLDGKVDELDLLHMVFAHDKRVGIIKPDEKV